MRTFEQDYQAPDAVIMALGPMDHFLNSGGVDAGELPGLTYEDNVDW